MDIDIEFYKKIADNEINNPQWGLSKQFIEVNEFEKTNNEYVYERYSIGDQTLTMINRNDSSKNIEYNYYEIVFYYKIKDEHYFFGIGVDINKNDVARVFMRNATYCYLEAQSSEMTLEEMAKLTNLKYSEGGTKGEKTNRGRGYYGCSWITYKFLNETSYELEECLNILLDELEKDKEGVKKLVEKTDACINICKYQYVSANAGIDIDKRTIQRLNELNLELMIDMYCTGEYMK
ncbi:MAG: DUF4279 domain-containing protein [Treponema sp.]|jgi:hypothetical protein|nr:DUF4279 domain-containing protein [Treponema sp.]